MPGPLDCLLFHKNKCTVSSFGFDLFLGRTTIFNVVESDQSSIYLNLGPLALSNFKEYELAMLYLSHFCQPYITLIIVEQHDKPSTDCPYLFLHQSWIPNSHYAGLADRNRRDAIPVAALGIAA